MDWKLLLQLLVIVYGSNAGLDFYISQQESFRVLGLTAELSYVRDGTVHDVAQQFVVPLPSHIQELCFVWENANGKPVKYSISFRVNNNNLQASNHHVSLNISTEGLVPKKQQIFCAVLECGPLTLPFNDIEVFMKVDLTFNNITSINVHIKKDCSADSSRNIPEVVSPTEDQSFVLYIAIGVGFSILLTSLVVVLFYLCPKNQSLRPLRNDGATLYSPVQASSSGEVVASVNNSESHPTSSIELEKLKHSGAGLKNPFHIARNDIHITGVLLEGTFGFSHSATLKISGEDVIKVIVKTAKDNAADVQINLMMEEGTRFQNVLHPNIHQLIGIVSGNEGKPMLVYPFVNFGNLKRWLLHCKGSLDGNLPHPLCTQDLVTVALQVLKGVQYLHAQEILHKDPATRNCVIDDRFIVKLTDMALSRDFFPSDYHCLGDNENRPIKWMAIESISRREFSTASDVWSFGVVLWEITTLAQQPYAEVDPFEVCHVLKDGYRLTQPINCPDELYAIMAYCWAASARKRPTASQLYHELHQFHHQLNAYI